MIRRESEAPENSQTLLPIKVLSRGDNGIFGIVKALKYSYFVFFPFSTNGLFGEVLQVLQVLRQSHLSCNVVQLPRNAIRYCM